MENGFAYHFEWFVYNIFSLEIIVIYFVKELYIDDSIKYLTLTVFEWPWEWQEVPELAKQHTGHSAAHLPRNATSRGQKLFPSGNLFQYFAGFGFCEHNLIHVF